MLNVLLDSLIDVAKAMPFLLFVYIIIGLIENRYSKKINDTLGKSNKFGPFFGSIFGCVPQCGFSIIASNLYAKRIITLGTLLAIFISTSDEAIPIILSNPSRAFFVIPIIAFKIFIALVFGYLIDLLLKKKTIKNNYEEACVSEKGCCGHDCNENKKSAKDLLWHPIVHTLRVSFFLFLISICLNSFFFYIGEEKLAGLLLNKNIFQPIIAALFGLIPNCFASVVIADLFTTGMLGFGSTIAGLSSGAGIGLLVLFKENKNLKENLKIAGLLFLISSFAGIVIQLLYK